jgi:ElaB/YqjD/DUF883 family membrane-anchored ribosome-binding protein
MFGSVKTRKAERIAERAWENLVAAVESAGATAKSATKHGSELVDEAQDKVSSAADEARRRANAAMDALAGKQPETPWALIAGALAAGAVLGWVAAAAAGRAPMLPTLQRSPEGLAPVPAPTTASPVSEPSVGAPGTTGSATTAPATSIEPDAGPAGSTA